MDMTIGSVNIQHFKTLMENAVDPRQRRIVERLLAEEEAKTSHLRDA